MVLCAHVDAGYLNKTQSRLKVGAHIYLLEDNPTPHFNSTVLTIATIIKFVMESAAKAELAALFIAARELVPHLQTLIDMGWPQPCSPMQTDNLTAVGVTNKIIVPKQSKNDGHDTMLATMSRLTKSVSLLLGCRFKKLG
jgi:hypothetical protein